MNTAMEITNKKNSLSIGVLNESKKYFFKAMSQQTVDK